MYADIYDSLRWRIYFEYSVRKREWFEKFSARRRDGAVRAKRRVFIGTRLARESPFFNLSYLGGSPKCYDFFQARSRKAKELWSRKTRHKVYGMQCDLNFCDDSSRFTITHQRRNNSRNEKGNNFVFFTRNERIAEHIFFKLCARSFEGWKWKNA